MEQNDTPAAEKPLQVPNRTTPTWEIELLLSGATVFTLWQIAVALPGFILYLLPRMTQQYASIGGVVYVYLASGVIMIGLAFIIHLALRAYWVALVGMHSVFPNGLRMDRVRGGPITKENLASRWQDMSAAIERADNRATLVFGLGIGVASVLIPITLTVLIIYGLVALVCWAVGQTNAIYWAFPTVTMALMLPYFVVVLVDRYYGHRFPRGGRAYQWSMRVLGGYSKVGMGREGNPLLTLYSTNVGEGRGSVVVSVVMLSSLMLATINLMGQRADLGLGNYGAFPDQYRGMPGTVDGRHYATLHQDGFNPLAPFIPAPEARGNFLRLVVPYVPSQHSRHLLACSGGSGEADLHAEEARRREAMLACFGKLYSLEIDGRKVDVAPRWYTESRRDLRGLLFMVPLETVDPGPHELVIRAPDPRSPESSLEHPLPDRIPFWR